jgi:hypothetical protein
MRAHPVKALNLIQDSTRHRWHEATATKTAAGPPATYNRLPNHGLDCSGQDGPKGSIERLVERLRPPLRPRACAHPPPDRSRRFAPYAELPSKKPGSARPMAGSSGVSWFFRASLGAVLCQIPDQTYGALTRGPMQRGLSTLVRILEVDAGFRAHNRMASKYPTRFFWRRPCPLLVCRSRPRPSVDSCPRWSRVWRRHHAPAAGASVRRRQALAARNTGVVPVVSMVASPRFSLVRMVVACCPARFPLPPGPAAPG